MTTFTGLDLILMPRSIGLPLESLATPALLLDIAVVRRKVGLMAPPVIDVRRRHEPKLLMPGEIPSPRNPPSGCSFRPRRRFAQPDLCTVTPPLERVAPKHAAGCHLWPDVLEERVAGADPPRLRTRGPLRSS